MTRAVYMLGFVDWLDWKFFNGNGVEDFRGRKRARALFGKMILGLIIGSFLGAAMEL
ncbi:MAG: hypothetical protein ACEROO_12325 [Candidatus Bathyarchaeota archaeon]